MGRVRGVTMILRKASVTCNVRLLTNKASAIRVEKTSRLFLAYPLYFLVTISTHFGRMISHHMSPPHFDHKQKLEMHDWFSSAVSTLTNHLSSDAAGLQDFSSSGGNYHFQMCHYHISQTGGFFGITHWMYGSFLFNYTSQKVPVNGEAGLQLVHIFSMIYLQTCQLFCL